MTRTKEETSLQELDVARWVTSFYDQGQHEKNSKKTKDKYPKHAVSGILTQNVRGFRDKNDNRRLWMAGWKHLMGGKLIQMILIQETHVATAAEATELEKEWCRLWGQTWRPENPMSHWGTSGGKTGGVAILIHPTVAAEYQRVETELAVDRALVIESKTRRVVNVYAPNDHSDREQFFSSLDPWIDAEREVFLAGDFNCVLHREQDRYTNGVWREPGTESPELTKIVQKTGLVDSRHIHEDSTAEPLLARLTYLSEGSGARLDRSYVSSRLRRWVVATEAVVPWRQTDHLGVVTWLKDPHCKALSRPLEANLYPIRGRSEEQIEKALGIELRQVLAQSVREARSWDAQLEEIAKAIRRVRRKEQQRATRQRKRREARQRRRITTLRDLIEYVEEREDRRAQVNKGKFVLTQSGNTAQILKRLAQRAGTAPISLVAGADSQGAATDANIMRSEWGSLFGRRHARISVTANMEASTAFFNVPNDRKMSKEANESLMRAITEEEVVHAMASLGTMKAAGDDRLYNDFYRDWKEVLAPAFTGECNRLLNGGEMPASFSRAIIVPISKGGDRTNALNYRPISLLQSSYKIYTKILAERVQQSLPTIINEDQNGFVRGRALANNVNLLRALLEQQYECDDDASAANPAIILLDFKKAYDTLDREFVLHALRTFGYTESFVRLVDNIHSHTTARFLVNGDLSEPFEIVSGIRQGCPLAPLLFLLAAEMLKHAIDNDGRLQGIALQGQRRDYVHTFSAFVDDSVVFLREGEMVTALTDVLQRFGELSGLHVQPQKSHAIVLNPRCSDAMLGAFPIVPVGTTVRYLGVLIGLAPLNELNWTHRVTKIESKLGILSKYTTCVPDRVVVVNIVCTASLMFTAQFFTPPEAILRRIDAIFRQYVWNGTISSNPRKCHKVDRDIMMLPTKLGGLGLCDYRGAILQQAAKTILRWNTSQDGKYWEAMRCIVADQAGEQSPERTWTHPSTREPPTTKTLGFTDNMLALGLQLTRTALGKLQGPPAGLIKKKSAVVAGLQAPEKGLRWFTSRTGQITIRREERARMTQLRQETYAVMPAEIRAFWNSFPWWENAWIRDGTGRSLRRTDFPAIAIDTIQELQLREVRPGTFEFIDPTRTRKTSTSTSRLATWLSIILVSAGALPGDPAGDNAERIYGWTRDDAFDRYEWRGDQDGTIVGSPIDQKWATGTTTGHDTITAAYSTWGQPIVFVAASGSARAAADLVRLQQHAGIVVHGHPVLQCGPTLPVTLLKHDTARSIRKRMADTHIRPLIESTARGMEKLISRLQRRRDLNQAFCVALQHVPLHSLHKHTWGTTAQQHFLWYRMTIGALPVRDNKGQLPACPFDFCNGEEEADVEHIMWDCVGARRAWTSLYMRWTLKLLGAADDQLVRHVAQKTAPQLGHTIREELNQETLDDQAVIECADRGWRVSCEAVAQSLWLQRNAAIFDRTSPSGFEHTEKTIKATSTQIRSLGKYLKTSSTERLEGKLLLTLATSLDETRAPASANDLEARLYFDGGSRGNPGTTGTGSVLIERERGAADWTVSWWNAHYLGDDATNNAAEHEALRRGAVECSRRYTTKSVHVTIIGDSQLVLRQVAGHNATASQDMRYAADRTRRALRKLGSYDLRHTLRDGNKMADFLANHAMDQRSTTTGPTGPDETTNALYDLLTGDIAHPTSQITHPHDLLVTLRHHLDKYRQEHPATTRKRQPQIELPHASAQPRARRHPP